MRTSRKGLIKITIFLVLIMGLFPISSWAILNHSFENEIHEQLQNISIKNGEVIESKLQTSLSSVEMLAISMGKLTRDQIIDLLNDLQETAIKRKFIRFGVSDIHGKCFTSDEHNCNMRDFEFFKNAIQGNASVTEYEHGVFEHTDVSIYAVPIYHNGAIVGVLHATQSNKELADSLIHEDIFPGSIFLIVNKEGNVIIDQNVASEEMRMILRSTSFSEQIDNKNIHTFTLQQETYLAATSLIDVNNWSIITLIPEGVVASKTSDFNTKLLIFYAAVTVVLFCLLLYIYMNKIKQNMEKADLLFVDSTVGLHNYYWFQETVQAYHNEHKKKCVIAIINIREFRYINRRYGYDKGNEILRYFMYHLNTEKKYKIFGARYEKDRYVALVHYDDEIASLIKTYITTLKHKIEQEFDMEIDLSVGLYIWQEDEPVQQAVDKASFAISSKQQVVCQYEASMEEKRLYENELQSNMEQAFLHGEFVVYYQPKVRLRDNVVMSGEALVRWVDPIRGIIPPGDFIPLFERNGFLESLDFYIYEQVCQFIKNYVDQGKEIRISFNVSLTYAFHENFAQKLYLIAQSYHIPCSSIEVEILETVKAESPIQLIALLKELHSYGFLIALDDFGSGYSSLNMLKEMPIDTLKIDQGFFTKNEDDKDKSEAILVMVSEMAHNLNLEIVAEGVETKEQLDFIRTCGCHFVQGYYYYKPMSSEDFIHVLEEMNK